jgi:hypothetical protein
LLVHHTGVSDEAQHRARGSSAWRGALDIEISVVPAKDDSPMEIVQRKSKDAELAQSIYTRLHSVEIPGWVDEDGQQVTSAVVVEADGKASEPTKKPSKLDGHRKSWEAAWWHAKAEERDGLPYLSRSALKEKLMMDGHAERTIRNMVNPSYDEKIIGALIMAEWIEPHEHGWIMINEVHASALLMRKRACA